MAFIPVVDAAEITLQFSQQDGSFAENVFCVQRSAAWDISHLNTMAAAFKTWWTTGDGVHAYQKYATTACSLVAIGARDMTTQTSDSVVYNTGLPIAGLDASAEIPLGITWALTARTGLAGRSFRGRTFVVGMATDTFATPSLNLIGAAAAVDWVDAFNALITAVPAADATCTLVVCSRVHNGAPRVSGVTTPITSYGYHNL